MRLLSVLRPVAVVLLAALAAGPGVAHEEHHNPPAADMTPVGELPAGTYKLDLSHTSLIFAVDHLGLSTYRARFTRIDGSLELDPAAPDGAKLVVWVDPKSLETDYPFEEPDFDAALTGPDWLDAGQFDEITFVSKSIEMTSHHTAKVTGDLAMRGVRRPVVLDVTFNGGYVGIPGDTGAEARIGFSATGSLMRSEFGITNGIPAEGSSLGVSDEVEMLIEAEFYIPKAEE